METTIDQLMYVLHVEECREFWNFVGLSVSVVIMNILLVWGVKNLATRVWDRFNMRKWSNWILAVAVVGICHYGMTKSEGIVSRIRYEYTDVEQRYLIDRGSYVTNDYIHIDFVRMIAPLSAKFYIAYYPISITNVDDIAGACQNLVTTTFDAFPVPCDIAMANATNYHFICYTDWTPGPSVMTNGVLHLLWQKPINWDEELEDDFYYFVPYRTGIYDNGEKLSPPTIEVDLSNPPQSINQPDSQTED